MTGGGAPAPGRGESGQWLVVRPPHPHPLPQGEREPGGQGRGGRVVVPDPVPQGEGCRVASHAASSLFGIYAHAERSEASRHRGGQSL